MIIWSSFISIIKDTAELKDCWALKSPNDINFFFVVPVCHKLVLDGLINIFKLFHALSAVDKLGNVKKEFLGAPRIEPGAAGWEARTLPLCYAAPSW